jgi:hypothetical protein
VHEIQTSGHRRNDNDSDFLSQPASRDETECTVQYVYRRLADYLFLNANNIHLPFHAVPLTFVPLRLGTAIPAVLPRLDAFINILCLQVFHEY